jgi:Family of unknown function (DUF6361)
MIGWIMLSRQAVASAEAALKSDQLGVRDEIGFLSLHQAFSDRFFPGTSVLHTRMRYALFVPWLMEAAQGNPQQLRKLELVLTWQLNLGSDKGNGVIGGSIPNRLPVQPASMIYWTALARWHILHPRPDGVVSSRGEVLSKIAAGVKVNAGRVRSEDGELPDDELHDVFASVPSRPPHFLRLGEAMDFNLTAPERKFLRKHLIGVCRGAETQTQQSLLARIADARLSVRSVAAPWAGLVREVADREDKAALTIAKRAAALAGIGRAAYAALVEDAKAKDGGQRTTRHRDDVEKLVSQMGADAIKLDLSALNGMAPGLPAYLLDVLTETQKWLVSGRQRVDSLQDVYRTAEVRRKGARARLADNLGGQNRRAEWSADDHPLAEPLYFRWGNVRRLLNDLEAP